MISAREGAEINAIAGYTMSRLVKLPEKFLASEVDGELIIVHGQSGAFFSLKDVGLAIWQKLDDEDDLQNISDQLVGEYDVEPSECRASVDRFASELVNAGIAEFA